MRESFRSRWLFGLLAGLILAGISSLWVIVAYIVTGGSALRSMGVSLPVVLLVYLFGALFGSIVFAVAIPLFRTRLGAAVGGFLIAVPLFIAIVSTLPGEDLRTLDSWRTVVLSAAFLGGLVGLITWEPSQPRGPDQWR
jgi:hypothetical protein